MMDEVEIPTTEERIDRCSNWIESQTHIVYDEETTVKRKYSSDCEESYYTDSEFDSVSECGTKKRRLKMIEEKYDLLCNWKDCNFDSEDLDVFIIHVANHIPQLKIKATENGSEAYACQWDGCIFETAELDEISRHVNYHSYHTKLKCIGSDIRSRVKLPKCRRNGEWKTAFDLPPPLLCRWKECLMLFNNYQTFLTHVILHIESDPHGNKVNGGVQCKWTGCSGIYRGNFKLKDHMRRHTKEKSVACPDCGATFASNTKFVVHCKRQIPIDVQGFQCSYCNKFYPTEGILRDHMRIHVFNYKCNFCEMSCDSPSSLAKHVRYRHVPDRNFHCQLCSHAAKSQQDLDTHMTVHTPHPVFSCSYEGCQYMCKTAKSLDRHLEKIHNKQIRWYCCHECPVKFQFSAGLTKHLTTAHRLQLLNGHTRFHYVQDEDGYYRLQQVRYEGIDEENTPPVNVQTARGNKFSFKVNHDSDIPQVQIFEHNSDEDDAETEEPQENSETDVNEYKSMPIISNILISIDETDIKGNIINSKIIETQETTELPVSDGPPIILTDMTDVIEQ